ncbi:MAG: uncharacterized protein PWR27_2427 [Petroclostridium sp.]|uniref:DUF2225 domain-containing protein n=1 Tax=Petroclostridium xylanilyticum TaxID=1792311 RepID=UPI000B98AC3D|nr:DUF2225 domain-containing protein [Petroclostridium xylanilyticum]MBZ4647615.1 hypothetical protein [Clostridia bacterium]MDK2811718.1 uncharacterized protein [Petroclostridium sp.]
MGTNFDSELFEGLKSLGFDNLDDISIYKKEDEKTEQKKAMDKNEEDYLFDRKIQCPVCGSNISVRAVRSSSVRILSRDSDFMVYYKGPNPMLYDAWVCIQCGYAAISSQFHSVSVQQIKAIREKICSKWKPKNYGPVYDVDVAIERYKLVLLNAIVKNAKTSERALICLKLGWLNRLKKDLENEKKFLYQALQGFIDAFEKERFPIAGMDEASLTYLIGELYRRLDDNSNALLWYSRVLCNRTAKNKIKDMAREQKHLISEEKKKEEISEQRQSKEIINTGKKQSLLSGFFNWGK